MKEIVPILRGNVPDVGSEVHRFLFNSEDIEASKLHFRNAVMQYLDANRYYVDRTFQIGNQEFSLNSLVTVNNDVNDTYVFKCHFIYPRGPEFTIVASTVVTQRF